jgi:hypothetical protein
MTTYYYTHEDMDIRKYKCFFWRGNVDIATAQRKIFEELGHRVVSISEDKESLDKSLV